MIHVNGMNVNVEISGKGTVPIVLLHGWGQSTEAFRDIVKHLETYLTVYNIDLPGFGLSDKPHYPFNTLDYAQVVKCIVDHFDLNNFYLLGHSFGGRVAIKYTAVYNNVKKLILVDSAGIVNKKKFNYYIKIYSYKFCKKLFSLPFLSRYKNKVLRKFGSTDFKNADEMMKKTMVKVVNEDLRNEMTNINCPTLLIWGTHDTATPINDAYIMKDHLNDCGIVKIKNAGHFSYLEDPYLFKSVLDSFFSENK